MKKCAEVRLWIPTLLLGLALGSLIGASRTQEVPPPKPRFEEPVTIAQPLAPRRQELVEPELETIHRDEIVVFGRDVHLRPNETCRNIVVIGGDATIEGRVERNVVVVFGASKVKGTVRGDLVTILGPANLEGKVHRCFVNILGSPTLGPNALIEREAVIVGGRLRQDAGSIIRGGSQEFAVGESLQWLGDWFRHGLLRVRPLPPQLMWAWFVAGLFLMIYVLMGVLFPRPLRACVSTLDEAPVAAFFVGLLGMVLFLPTLLLLAVTVVGAPLLMLSLVVAIFFGKVAIYQFTGQQLGRQLNLATLQGPLTALLLGAVIFALLYTVPIIGFLAWGVGVIWGVGAVLMAVFATFKRESKPAPAYVVPAGSGAAKAGPVAPPSIEGVAAAPPVLPAGSVPLERAGFWIRVAATLIDLLLVGVFSLFPFLGYGLAFPFLVLIYHIAMWTWKGTTIGGIVFGLKIVRVDGRPIDFAVAMVRCLFSIISAVVFLIGFFWAGWDKERQSWHDKIAGTVIVKVPKGISLV